MRRRDFLKAVGVGAASLVVPGRAGSALQSSPERRPNFVFILIDDMGFKDLGEKNNLAETMPDKAKELRRTLIEWRKSVDAPVPTEKNPQYDPAARRQL